MVQNFSVLSEKGLKALKFLKTVLFSQNVENHMYYVHSYSISSFVLRLKLVSFMYYNTTFNTFEQDINRRYTFPEAL